MNKKIIIIASFIACLGIIAITIGMFLGKDTEKVKKEPKREIPINDNTRFFTCKKNSNKQETYQLDYKYDFYFTDGELKSGTLYYVYTFENQQIYNTFKADFSKMDTTVVESKDDNKLIRTYSI